MVPNAYLCGTTTKVEEHSTLEHQIVGICCKTALTLSALPGLYWSTDFRWCSFWQLTPLFKATYAMLRPYPDKKIRKALYG